MVLRGDNMELGNLIFGNSRGRYEVPRGIGEDDFIWQETFIKFMYEIGLDGYGYLENNELEKYKTERGGFENDTFTINPYYWGEDESIMQEPNFVFKPTGLKIDWYKYPFRDSYSNKEITFEELKQILKKCKESVRVNK